MSGHKEQEVDTNSAEFKHGELGLELKKEVEDDEPVSKSRSRQSSTPLFMRDSPEGNKGNAQDEKDETAE